MPRPIHTSDKRKFNRLWMSFGGDILALSGTGEARYVHCHFVDTVRINDRRHDVPAVLLSRLNQLIRSAAANDPRHPHTP